MAAAPVSSGHDSGKRGRRTDPGRSRRFYTSDDIAASASRAASVRVEVSLKAPSGDMAKWRAAGKEAMKEAFVSLFSSRFSSELDEVVRAYRLMIRESLAKGDDRELQAALNRARLQEKILASTSMVDQAQACQLLGLSMTNPSATMRRKENRGELLRFSVDGRALYPLFQFDVEERRIFPAIARLIELKPESWSNFRLLHWLTRPHLELKAVPADCLGREEAEVIAAFKREIVPPEHG